MWTGSAEFDGAADVQSRPCDCRTASGSTTRAASPRSPPGKITRKVASISARWSPAVPEFLRLHRDAERLRLGAAGGQHVHVDRGEAADGGQEKLEGAEVGVIPGADGDRPPRRPWW